MVASNNERLREERDRFVGFAFAGADLLLELDNMARVHWIGGAVKSILHIEPEQIVEQPLTRMLAENDAVLLGALLHSLRPGQRRRGLRFTLRTQCAPTVEACISRSLNATDQRFYLSLTQAPPTAQREAAMRQRDRVTGLLEAVEFTQAASSAVQLARQSGKTACLTLIEICEQAELKRLLGHDRSEALLAEIGAQLKMHAVDQDAAGHVGAGKFGVAHLEGENPATIVEAITRVGESFRIDKSALKLRDTTVSFHKTSLADNDVEGILSYVVTKFAAEGAGGIKGGSAEEFLRKKTAETLSRVVSMRDLLHERMITLHYQPIVGLARQDHHHYEVLLRFADGRSPFEDVKFAEEINIIHELDLAVANGAVRRILEAADKKRHLSLAVNMSAKSLLNDSFMNMFEQVTERLGTDRKKLMIEVTESAKLDDLSRAAKAVERLGARGHGVCLDDFGAGASSLPYLQQLCVDYVKIDGVYIRSITDSLRERAIVQGVLITCKWLGIRTVAEMVEREDQHKCLLDLGVDFGQGWFYGKPAPDIPAAVPARAGERTQGRPRANTASGGGRVLMNWGGGSD